MARAARLAGSVISGSVISGSAIRANASAKSTPCDPSAHAPWACGPGGCGPANCTFAGGVAQDLAWPGHSFDLVTCTLAVHHIPEAGRAPRVRP